MGLPVTVTDGQRLQIIFKSVEMQNEIAQISTTLNSGNSIQKVQRLGVIKSDEGTMGPPKLLHPTSLNAGSLNKAPVNLCNKTTQTPSQHGSTLDEITNKVFNELMQGKVEAQMQPHPRNSDQCSNKV